MHIPRDVGTLSAIADDTGETERERAASYFISPAAQGPSLDVAEKTIMEERAFGERHIRHI